MDTKVQSHISEDERVSAAIWDTVGHGVNGALLFLPCMLTDSRFRGKVVLAFITGSLLNADHFIAVRSFDISAAIQLAHRPFAHTLWFAFGVFLFFAISRRSVAGWVIFVSLCAHLLRDCAFGTGCAVMYPLYESRVVISTDMYYALQVPLLVLGSLVLYRQRPRLFHLVPPHLGALRSHHSAHRGVAITICVHENAVVWRRGDLDGELLGGASAEDLAGAVPLPSMKQYMKLMTCRVYPGLFWGTERGGPDGPLFGFDTEEACEECICALRVLAQRLPPQASLPKRSLLVLINPFGGGGAAELSYRAVVAPVFDAAGISVTSIVTATNTHARSILNGSSPERLDITEFDGVVCVSGDGMLHECLEGWMERPDKDSLPQIPFGIIPCGTSNGLAATVGCFDVSSAALLIVRGHVRPMDVMQVSLAGQTHYCFLQVAWAVIADVNYGSDPHRWIGSARKTLAALPKLVSLNSYHAKLTITHVPTDDMTAPRCSPSCSVCTSPDIDAAREETTVIDDDIVFFCAANTRYITNDIQVAPLSHFSDGLCDIYMIRKSRTSRLSLLKLFSQTASGKHVGNPTIDHYRVRRFTLDAGTSSHIDLDGEIHGTVPITMDMMRGAMRVFAPGPPT